MEILMSLYEGYISVFDLYFLKDIVSLPLSEITLSDLLSVFSCILSCYTVVSFAAVGFYEITIGLFHLIKFIYKKIESKKSVNNSNELK